MSILTVDFLEVTTDDLKTSFGGREATSAFQTAKGSVYFRTEDGSTIRHKAIIEGHPDSGWKEASDITLFISAEDAEYIAGPLHGTAWLLLVEHEGEFQLQFVLKDYKTKKITKVLETIDFQTEPEVGLSPIELFQLKEVKPGVHYPHVLHPGHAITDIGTF